MKFARVVFLCAGAWGVLLITPMYFLYAKIGEYSSPPPTHPEFYYGFVDVTLAWQIAFFVIARDPMRLRPMIIPAVLEKLSYLIAVIVLHSQSRITTIQLTASGPDALLCLLFVLAFFKTHPSSLPEAGESKALGGVQ